MQIQPSSNQSPLRPAQIDRSMLGRIDERARVIREKAMELTDTWGGAMFIMEPSRCEKLFRTLGFATDVAAEVYQRAYDLHYVRHIRAQGEDGSAFTWHGPDVTILVLRGFADPSRAFAEVNDANAASYIERNLELFRSIMDALPRYASNLMFSTKVGCNVLGAFGASISESKLFELALEYGNQHTTDLEGRRGVPTQFVRAFTLLLSATVE